MLRTHCSKGANGVELALGSHLERFNVVSKSQRLDILQTFRFGPSRPVQGLNLSFRDQILHKREECAWGVRGTSGRHEENVRRCRYLNFVNCFDVGLIVTYLTDDDFSNGDIDKCHTYRRRNPTRFTHGTYDVVRFRETKD